MTRIYLTNEQSEQNSTFQDGEMPRIPPAQVKFTRKSWFGLRKTYKVIKVIYALLELSAGQMPNFTSHQNLATTTSPLYALICSRLVRDA